ncbi:cobyrinate a,c-diamide synthase [Nitrospira defluvii]|uniref:Cobyrinate a,c-diamide synthase n=1 Tax=Nitrospira defluvii TaxID=330214 RepID=A0ABN7LZZ3_9BACT|nr:cobyrinate a,c-diamide synthase [Nitrospira defluvii]CAE6777962.1 Cobyrinate a,c-diamide synthase [Nitrospira defluvii]
MTIPRLVIAGVSSNVGKTTVMVGLVRALRARGLKVAVFKCGPDYLDPTYHVRAAGAPCHNLDGWMMGREAVLSTFMHASQGADIAILEGVMGLFDGASPTSDEGSTAEIAKWLQAPVLLVCDAGGMARSIAALARGFSTFDADLQIAGLICNRLGSRGHLDLLRKVTEGKPPVLGGLPKEAALAFSDRHLGLHSADRATVPEGVFVSWGDRVSEWCDVDAIIALAKSAPALPEISATARIVGEGVSCRIGLAFDEAFHFYYDDNLRRLEGLGAELVRFSPLHDAHLPDVDGLYFGGGYPEVHAEALSRNQSMRKEVAAFAEAQGPIYGECGGLMYLSNGIRTLDGTLHPMVGLIPGEAEMKDRLQALGYVEVDTKDETMLGPSGLRFRGHQFRYSDFRFTAEVECAYHVRRRRGGEAFQEGYRQGNTLVSYVHAHWASNPLLAEGFVQACVAHAKRVS